MFHEEQVVVGVRPAVVWAALADVQGWRKWTASVELIRRREQARPFGAGSEAWVKQPKLPGAVWRVTAFDAPHGFVWETRVPGVRTVAGHRVEPAAGGTLVTLELRQTGPLAPLVALFRGRLIRRYLVMEAAGLKAYCEGLSTD